jgi:hypothetical protein
MRRMETSKTPNLVDIVWSAPNKKIGSRGAEIKKSGIMMMMQCPSQAKLS